jgi:DNA replication and repair protein RecF
MKISNLNMENIRNHHFTNMEFNFGLNILFGLNGAGKTSILEAISICGFTKSFLPVGDSSLISNGKNKYRIIANSLSDNDIPYKVNINYEKGCRKKISSSIGDNLTAKDIIGDLPIVILSPDYKSITFGSPENRRSFMDRLLSQISKVYIDDLLKFRKALRQRNSLLGDLNFNRKIDKRQLEPWTELVIKVGKDIILKRMKFIEEFNDIFMNYYKIVSSDKEKVELVYKPMGLDNSDIDFKSDNLEDVFKSLFDLNFNDECRRGITLFGPHKDDILITINGGVAREFASQGQHKSLLIALKMGEFEFLKKKKNETPVVLLDDIFSELDENRISKVLELIFDNSAQTMITVTNPETIKRMLMINERSSYFEITDGFVKRIN